MGDLAAAIAATQAKVLVLDIETSPHLVYTFNLHGEQHVGLTQIVEASRVLCFAAKWVGDDRVTFRSEHHHDRERMIEQAWKMIDAADIIVGYNSRGFDLKHLMREFSTANLGPPSPHKDVDLLLVARRRFKFASNKLDWVASELGQGFKLDHEGFGLWRDCLAGDAKAWRTMKAYNIEDVALTERLYVELLPWIPNHPNMNLYRDERVSGCPTCGSDDVVKRGVKRTASGVYQQFRCNQCGGWSRATHRDRAHHRVPSAG